MPCTPTSAPCCVQGVSIRTIARRVNHQAFTAYVLAANMPKQKTSRFTNRRAEAARGKSICQDCLSDSYNRSAPRERASLVSFQGPISANLQLTAIGARCRGARAEASTPILAILGAETTKQEDTEPYGFVQHNGRLAGVVPPSGTYSRLRKSCRSTLSVTPVLETPMRWVSSLYRLVVVRKC